MSLTYHDNAQNYYGKELESSADLKTNACCPIDSVPSAHRKLLANINDEVLDQFYGCGSPIPDAIEGLKVLDLGCGTGRDVYLAAQLTGQEGFVHGVDMTPSQLDVAKRHISDQMKRFGYSKPNVNFHLGKIEDLKSLGFEDHSVDLVTSNCVINLAPDKSDVFKEIFRVLKPGGELYFSDIFASRRIPEAMRNDAVLHGECLSGALYTEDFRRILADLGCPDYRIIQSRILEISDNAVSQKLRNISFYSRTIRAFKLDQLEDRCEDYGHVATYLGNLNGSKDAFVLDDHHVFEASKPELICGNTASMLSETRYKKYFRIDGNRSCHYGLFNCKDSPNTAESTPAHTGSCC